MGCGLVVGAAVVAAIIYAGVKSESPALFVGSLVLAGVVIGLSLKGK